eukprot:2184202-Pyramimonas_sp.AAC.1
MQVCQALEASRQSWTDPAGSVGPAAGPAPPDLAEAAAPPPEAPAAPALARLSAPRPGLRAGPTAGASSHDITVRRHAAEPAAGQPASSGA